MTNSDPEEKPKIRAIVVGVNRYIASEGLKYAMLDASSVNDSMSKLYGNVETILMTDNSEPRYQPARSNILSNIKLVSENVMPNENILFYFAGHGKDIDGEPVILPFDYRDEIGLQAAIRIEDIKTSFVGSKAKFKLMILDSCHSGAVKGRAESGRMSSSTFKALNEVPEGFAVISACSLDQISYEDETLKHGVFTHFLLEGIQGKADANNDKIVTINELYDYLTLNVKEWVFKKHNASQIPHMRANFGGLYILSKLPPDSPRTEELYGSELFSRIYLWQQSHQMDLLKYNAEGIDPDIKDSLESSTEKILLVLRKEYGINGLVDNGNTIDFNDGAVLRHKEENERRESVDFRVGVQFNYIKERWNIIDNLLLELDNLTGAWSFVSFVTEKKFDFAAIEKLCADNGFEIVGLTLKPRSITFSGHLFSDRFHKVCLKEFDDCSTVYVENILYPPYLGEHFYALINPKKISEMLGNSVLA